MVLKNYGDKMLELRRRDDRIRRLRTEMLQLRDDQGLFRSLILFFHTLVCAFIA